MKLLIQHNQEPDEISGVLAYINTIVTELKSRKVEVKVISTRESNFQQWLKSLVWSDAVQMNSNQLFFALLAKLLGKKIILKYHYPIYESTHFEYKKLSFLEQIRAEVVDSIPGNNYPLKWKIYPIVRWSRLLKRLATALVADYHTASSQLLSKSCVLPWPVFTLYNPIAIPNCLSPKQLKDLSYPYTFIFAGRLHFDKGVDLLIKAARLLLNRRQDFRVLVIGDGRDFERLNTLVSELELSSHVSFIGKLTHPEVLAKITEAIALVYPSRWEEPVGYTVLEAARVQTCTIVSNKGALPEMASLTSFFFESEDVEALASHLNYCLDHPEELLARGRQGSRYVAEKFSPDKRVDQLLSICQQAFMA
ncbi:MAG: glycosyltransferase family 4 protein [Symploca sp. SIO1A3]|nr:glycosyltransferase family 4 protein [Symploca sp. SIO1A3]